MRALHAATFAVALSGILAGPARPQGARPPNPLGRPAWAGRFVGEDVEADLRPGPAPGEVAGTIVARGAAYPARGRVEPGSPARLVGTFTTESGVFDFEAGLDAGEGEAVLVLTSGGATYRLRRVDPGPLAPADDRPGSTAWRHPAGWVAFELPAGWQAQVTGDEGEVVVLTPGSDAAGAVVITGAPLDPDDRPRDPAALLAAHGEGLLAALDVRATTRRPVGDVTVGGLPGAVATWAGSRGGAPVEAWLVALRLADHAVAVVALADQGRLEGLLPGARRVVTTLRLTPPSPTPAAPVGPAGDLAGLTFRHVETFKGGSFYSALAFEAAGRVVRSQSMPGGATEAVGAWSLEGSTVRLRFDDGADALEVVRDGAGAPTALRRPDGRTYRRQGR